MHRAVRWLSLLICLQLGLGRKGQVRQSQWRVNIPGGNSRLGKLASIEAIARQYLRQQSAYPLALQT